MAQCLEAKKCTFLQHELSQLGMRGLLTFGPWGSSSTSYARSSCHLTEASCRFVHSELSACVCYWEWIATELMWLDTLTWVTLQDIHCKSHFTSYRSCPLSELLGGYLFAPRVQHGDPCAEHNSGSSSATARGWTSIATIGWCRFAMFYIFGFLYYVLTIEALSPCNPDSSKQVNRQCFAFWIVFTLFGT